MSFSGFSIDHAEFIANLAGWWAMLNPSGITTALLNILCGAGLTWIFFHMSDDKDDNKDGSDE
jgi:hypothetical protein